MKQYENVEIEIIALESADVITTSGSDAKGDDWGYDIFED